MDSVQDSEAGSVRRSVDSASKDSVQDSEAGSVRHSVDSASMDPVRYSVAGSAVRSVDSDLQPMFPGSYLYIQMNSDLRNLP